MDLTFTKKNIIAFILAFLVVITLQPYFVWANTKYANIFAGIVMLVISLSIAKLTIYNVRISIFFVICNLYYFFGGTHYTTFSPIFFLPLFFLLLPNDYKLVIFKKFNNIISIIFALGFITYSLRFFINLPYINIPPLNPLKAYTYNVYLFDITIPQTILPRFMSLFDEPGVVGTLCALLISYKKIALNSFNNIVILLAGIFSFSLAFYVILILNLLYNFKKNYSIVFILVLLLFSILPKDSIFYTQIVDRLEFVDGGFSGDNRMNKTFAMNSNSFINNGGKDLFFGRGMGSEKFDDINNQGSSTYKVLVYRHGLIGVGLFLLFFIYITWLLAPSIRGGFYLTVFILLLYQRINLFLYYNIVVYVGGLLMITYNDSILKRTSLSLRDYK